MLLVSLEHLVTNSGCGGVRDLVRLEVGRGELLATKVGDLGGGTVQDELRDDIVHVEDTEDLTIVLGDDFRGEGLVGCVRDVEGGEAMSATETEVTPFVGLLAGEAILRARVRAMVRVRARAMVAPFDGINSNSRKEDLRDEQSGD